MPDVTISQIPTAASALTAADLFEVEQGGASKKATAAQIKDFTGVDGKLDKTAVGAANGAASLGSDGKMVMSEFPAGMLGQVSYQGTWNASSGAPAASPTKGQYWIVTTAGTTNLSGITDWQVGDWAIYSGTAWNKVDNTDAVVRVAGLTGDVAASSLKIALAVDKVDNTADADKPVSTPQAAALAGKMAASLSDLPISGPAGSGRIIRFMTNGVMRWALSADTTAETGGNSGSNLSLYRYSDTGASLTSSFVFVRSTGELRVDGPSIRPVTTNTTSLGIAGAVYTQVYAQNTTISTSDARYKTPLRPLTDAEVAAGVEISETIGIGQWLDKVEEEGDAARLHVWQIAQEVIAIFERHGLDPFAQSFVCHDTWDEELEQWDDIPGTDAICDADGNEIRPAVPAQRVLTRPYQPAGERYSLRYIELLMFCHAAKVIDDNRRFAKLEARLAKLGAAA